MNRRLWAALVAVLMVLSVAACGAKDNSGLLATAAQGETTSTATADEDPPPDDGTAGIEDSDGELRPLSLVDDNGVTIEGDSTTDPRSPASYQMAKEQGPLVTWADAVRVLGGLDWYVDAVNARKGKTGFDWNDVKKWATADGVDPRVIQVFNLELSDQSARDAVRELIGDAADRLPIARHQTCTVNTRGFGREKVQDFVDCRKMVRVALAPIVYNEKGEVLGLRSDTGIFVDCFNIWWIPRQVVKNGPPPTTTQPVPPGSTPPGESIPPGETTSTTRPTTTSTTTPGGTTTTTRPRVLCPDGTPLPPNGLCPKDPSQSTAGTGQHGGQEEGPSEGPTSEPAVIPPATYVPPTTPTIPPTTRPPVTAPPTTSPPATTPPTTAPPTTVIQPPR